MSANAPLKKDDAHDKKDDADADAEEAENGKKKGKGKKGKGKGTKRAREEASGVREFTSAQLVKKTKPATWDSYVRCLSPLIHCSLLACRFAA